MKKNYLFVILLMLILLFYPALSCALPVKFTVKATGIETIVIQNQTIEEHCGINPETNITECINETKIINQTIENPWSDSAVIDIECGSVCTYPMPDFGGKNINITKYEIKYNIPDVVIVFEGTKNKLTTDSNDKIRIEIVKKSAELIIEKISPTTFKEGTSQVNVFIKNNGSITVNYLNVTLIGAGIVESYAESKDPVEPEELSIVPVIVDIKGEGQKDVIVKASWPIDGKTYNTIYLTRINIIAENKSKPEAEINATEIINKFNLYKEKLREYELEYSRKKSEGYLVSEVYDSIKNARNHVSGIQLDIEEKKFSSAKSKLLLLELSLEEIDYGLKNSLKQKITLGERLRQNALLISALVAAIAGIIGLYEKQRQKLKQIKEKMKNKKSKNITNITEKENAQSKKENKKTTRKTNKKKLKKEEEESI
ncbi:MAG: hypothetical protein QXG86_00490 [Candidatus Woesearchaeota archaeon]